MIQTETLYIYKDNKRGIAQKWPSANLPAMLGKYTYSAQRMGAAPTLKATLMYPRCLDRVWSRTEYVIFNGERYTVDQIPTSGVANDTGLYKHELTFVSERVKLENVYLLDVVTENTEDTYKDRYRSNDTKVYFYGTISELASRITDSLIYCGLCTLRNGIYSGYHVVVDEGIENGDIQQITFDNVFVAGALQQFYEKWGVGYYFVGKTIHIGYAENAIPDIFEYGIDGGLLSVTKTNENSGIVDRMTGIGSKDNIPYYYPNDSPEGLAQYTTENLDAATVEINLGKVSKAFDGNVYQTFRLRSEQTFSITLPAPRQTTLIGITYKKGTGYYRDKGVSVLKLAYTYYIYVKNGTKIVVPNRETGSHSVRARDVNGNWRNCTRQFGMVGINVWPEDSLFIRKVSSFQAEDYRMCYRPFSTVEDYIKYENKLAKNVATLYEYDLEKDGVQKEPGLYFSSKECEHTLRSDGYYLITLIDSVVAGDGNSPLIPRPEVASNYVPMVELTYLDNVTASRGEYNVVVDSNGKSCKYVDSGITITPFAGQPMEFVTYDYSYHQSVFDTLLYLSENKSNVTNPASITITGRRWIQPTQCLMPYVFRQTFGVERFYNATNSQYGLTDYFGDDVDISSAYMTDSQESEMYHFENEYNKNNPHEYRDEFSDIRPSIKDMRNKYGELLGEIADVAFDSDDNNLPGDGSQDTPFSGNVENIAHSYFYIKLHRFDCEEQDNENYGFNLFEQALEGGTAMIEMTSGNCAGCKFEIGIVEPRTNEFKNPVLVDDKGDILDGSFRDKVTSWASRWQDRQQNTVPNEVWIAVKKDNTTFGTVLPDSERGIVPAAGDTFVITGIKMPKSYVIAAERRLSAAIVKQMWESNTEKFNFSIKFSRVWLNLHRAILGQINENARLVVRYNGADYLLYVSQFTCKADGNSLNEITVELSQELSANSSKLRDVIQNVAGKLIMSHTTNGDTLAVMTPYFLRKDVDDTTPNSLSVGRNLDVGKDISIGGKLSVGSEAYVGGKMNVDGLARMKDGVIFGSDFVGGRTGFGGMINNEGAGELKSLVVREFLEVPELRYNRTTVETGTSWRAPGGGIIEKVEITSENAGIIYLHLEEGEIGAVAVNDICQGIYHSEDNMKNAHEDSDDGEGYMEYAGFATVYFVIQSVEDWQKQNEDGSTSVYPNGKVTYRLRGLDDGARQLYHPAPFMNFVCYGNFEDTNRQKSVYATRTYERYLFGVNNWSFSEANIAMQLGDLSNLHINGTDMKGYSAYLNNIYMSGTIQQIDAMPIRIQKDISTTFLGESDSPVTMTCQLTKGDFFEELTAQVTSWAIMRSTGNTAGDNEWNNTRGNQFSGNQFTFQYSDLADSTIPTVFTIKAVYNGKEYTETLVMRQTPKGEKGEDGKSFEFNLLDGTAKWEGAWVNTAYWADTDEVYNGCKVKRSTRQWSGLYQLHEVQAGQQYTFSAWVRTENGGRAGIYTNGGTATLSPNSKTGVPYSEWTRISLTFTVQTSGMAKIRLENSVTSGYVYTAGHKLERGSETTEWAPSKADIQGADGRDGIDGKDAETYSIVPSVTTVRCSYNETGQATYAPDGTFTLKILQHKGATIQDITSTISNLGITLYKQPIGVNDWSSVSSATQSFSTHPEGYSAGTEFKIMHGGIDIATVSVPIVYDGRTAISSFISWVFFRTTATLDHNNTPTGGSYASPTPTTHNLGGTNKWQDSIPSGTAPLWATYNTFKSDGKDIGWKTPLKMTSTANLNIMYCVQEDYGGVLPPNAIWTTTPSENAIWMAVRTITDGVASAWSINKIKGEKGVDGYGFAFNLLDNSSFNKRTDGSNADGWTKAGGGVFGTSEVYSPNSEYTATITASYTDILKANITLKANTPYVFSWYSRHGVDGNNGTARLLPIFNGANINTGKQGYIDGKPHIFNNNGYVDSGNDVTRFRQKWSDGFIRHSVAFTSGSTDRNATLLIRLYKDSTNPKCSFTCPKLEVDNGSHLASPWTVSANDIKGESGLDGATYRTSDWVRGKQYLDGSTWTGNIRFVDVCYGSDNKPYICIKTHNSNDYNLGAAGYWQKMSDTAPIHTKLILAENAVINFGQANQLLVQGTDGAIKAGMCGTADADKPVLFAGSNVENTTTAPFRVYQDGKMCATGAEITGNIKCESLSFTSYESDSSQNATSGSMVVARNGTSYTLPELAEGEMRSVKYLGVSSPNYGVAAFFSGATRNVLLYKQDTSSGGNWKICDVSMSDFRRSISLGLFMGEWIGVGGMEPLHKGSWNDNGQWTIGEDDNKYIDSDRPTTCWFFVRYAKP